MNNPHLVTGCMLGLLHNFDYLAGLAWIFHFNRVFMFLSFGYSIADNVVWLHTCIYGC